MWVQYTLVSPKQQDGLTLATHFPTFLAAPSLLQTDRSSHLTCWLVFIIECLYCIFKILLIFHSYILLSSFHCSMLPHTDFLFLYSHWARSSVTVQTTKYGLCREKSAARLRKPFSHVEWQIHSAQSGRHKVCTNPGVLSKRNLQKANATTTISYVHPATEEPKQPFESLDSRFLHTHSGQWPTITSYWQNTRLSQHSLTWRGLL